MLIGEWVRIFIFVFLKIWWESFLVYEIIYFNIWFKLKLDIVIYENRFVVIYKWKVVVYNLILIYKDLKFVEFVEIV